MAESANLAQLNSLRTLTLRDASHYKTIVPKVLGFFAPGNVLEQRRFGADFLAEMFASPLLPVEDKQALAVQSIELLRQFLETPGEDAAVVKSVVQASTSVYPLIFKHIVYNPSDNPTWTHMAAVKSNILRRMDSSPAGVKVCCIKFIQRVVQVQTPGQISDPRRPEHNEVSMALVPPNHPLIAPPSLEPEASGLLDRLLSVFQEMQSDAVYVTATLNCVGVLLRTRPAISSRILNAVLGFNPFTLADGGLGPRVRVQVKSIERSVRAFLTNLIKRSPDQQWLGRIQGHLDRMQQHRAQIFDEQRKRPAPTEPTDGLDPAKRQRLDASLSTPTPPGEQIGDASGPGPMSLAQIFTLTSDPNLINDISSIAKPVVDQLIVPLMRSVDRQRLDVAINTVRARWLQITQANQPTAPAPTGPPAPPSAPTDQVMNHLNSAPSHTLVNDAPQELDLGPLIITQPPSMSPPQLQAYGHALIDRVLSSLNTFESGGKKPEKTYGIQRLAASTHDRDAWVTMLTRLATRPFTGLNDDNHSVKSEDSSESQGFSISDGIREGLVKFILTDFRKRIEIAISWLNEEWYNDRVQAESASGSFKTYNTWALRFLDGLLPYIDNSDRLLIRFMSEIPEVNKDLLERIKRVAQDPERVSLAIAVLQYLIMFRVPARNMCLDVLEDIYNNNPAAKTHALKVLQKHRPSIISAKTNCPTPPVTTERAGPPHVPSLPAATT